MTVDVTTARSTADVVNRAVMDISIAIHMAARWRWVCGKCGCLCLDGERCPGCRAAGRPSGLIV